MRHDAPTGPWVANPVTVMSSVSDPSSRGDLLELYFGGGSPAFEIFQVTRPSIASPWGTPISVVSSAERDNAPELVGNELFFTTTRRTGTLDRDVFRVVRTGPGQPWTMPQHVTDLETGDESDVGVQPGGLRAIIGWRPNQQGQADLVEWTRPVIGGTWTESRTLSELCSASDDLNATLTGDGLTVYFSSNRNASTHDLFTATRPSLVLPFEAPQPIFELNTSANEADPWISPDGHTLLFTRGTVLWEARRQ
jgi:hypothetical protein